MGGGGGGRLHNESMNEDGDSIAESKRMDCPMAGHHTLCAIK